MLSIEITYLESKILANELTLKVNTLVSFSYKTSIRAQINLLLKVFSSR